jgi:hypothetical protein
MDPEIERIVTEVLDEDVDETVVESLAALRKEGLVQWNGAFRNGQPVWVLTEKGAAVQKARSSGDLDH